MRGSHTNNIYVFDHAGKLLYRSTPGVNVSLGAIAEFICKGLNKNPAEYAIYDPEGRRLQPTKWTNSIERPALLTLLPSEVPPAIKEPLALFGAGCVNGVHFQWTAPTVVGSATTRARVVCDTVQYDRLPSDVLNVILRHVDNPVTLMDLRVVCRSFCQFIDDNLERLVEPFRKQILRCCEASYLGSVSLPSPTAKQLLAAVSMVVCRLPPPTDPVARVKLMELFLSMPQDGRWFHEHCRFAVAQLQRLAAAARAVPNFAPHPGKSAQIVVNLTARILAESRAALPGAERVDRGNPGMPEHFPGGFILIACRGKGVFEAWIDARDDRVHVAEVNMVRLHAMLMASGPWLWEQGLLAGCCHVQKGLGVHYGRRRRGNALLGGFI